MVQGNTTYAVKYYPEEAVPTYEQLLASRGGLVSINMATTSVINDAVASMGLEDACEQIKRALKQSIGHALMKRIEEIRKEGGKDGLKYPNPWRKDSTDGGHYAVIDAFQNLPDYATSAIVEDELKILNPLEHILDIYNLGAITRLIDGHDRMAIYGKSKKRVFDIQGESAYRRLPSDM